MAKQWSLMYMQHFLNVTKSGDRFVKLKSFVIPMNLWDGLYLGYE